MNAEEIRQALAKLGEALGVEVDVPDERERRTPKEFFDEAVEEASKMVSAGASSSDVLAKFQEVVGKAIAAEQGSLSTPAVQNDATTAAREQSDKTASVGDVKQPTPTAWSSTGLQKAFDDLLKAVNEAVEAREKPKREKPTKASGGFEEDLQKGIWPRDVNTPDFREDVRKASDDDWGSDPWEATA